VGPALVLLCVLNVKVALMHRPWEPEACEVGRVALVGNGGV
jgi:hypothetical protein